MGKKSGCGGQKSLPEMGLLTGIVLWSLLGYVTVRIIGGVLSASG